MYRLVVSGFWSLGKKKKLHLYIGGKEDGLLF